MKAIIPVAGIGSRLRPHTHTQPKALVPVAGKPILAHIVDNLVDSGINEFIFIVGYLGDKVEEYVKSNYPSLQKKFILQEPREGIGHAVWLAKNHITDRDEVVIALGDTVFDIDLKQVLNESESSLGVKKVDDPRTFGVAELEGGFIKNLVEKPPIPKSNLALVGLYKIKEAKLLMEALEENIQNNFRTYNEYQLTDGIMMLINKGVKMKTFSVENWYDCGTKESLLETNAVLLKKTLGQDFSKYEFENTIIIPPVSISEHCRISNSIIGPNVSIGDHSIINYSILKDAIIGSYSELQNAVLHHSVIGSDASLHGLSQSLNIGDNTEIDFG